MRSTSQIHKKLAGHGAGQPISPSKSKKKSNIQLIMPKKAENPKKRKRQKEDPTYNPKRRRQNENWNPKALCEMRADTEREFIDKGKKVPVRTAFMLDTSRLKVQGQNLSPRKTTAVLSRILKEKKPDSCVDILEVVSSSKYGSPVKIKGKSPTSNKIRVLTADGGDGSIKTFSNRQLNMDVLDVPGTIAPDHSFFATKVSQKIKPYSYPCKENEVILSKKNNIKNKNNIARTVFSKPNPKTTVGVSAQDFAIAFFDGKKVEGVKFELLHNVADMFARYLDHPQWVATKGLSSADNIILGTKDSNTNMLFQESAIRKYLIDRYPQGFTLYTKTHLTEKEQNDQEKKDYLHLGKWLEYTITTPDFSLHKRFDLLDLQQPFIDYMYARLIEMQALIELSDQQKNNNNIQVTHGGDDDKHKRYCYQSTRKW